MADDTWHLASDIDTTLNTQVSSSGWLSLWAAGQLEFAGADGGWHWLPRLPRSEVIYDVCTVQTVDSSLYYIG